MKTHVIARKNNESIDFFIDFESGELTGNDSRRVERLISLSGDPVMFDWQQSYPAPDPTHNPSSLALILMSDGFFEIEGDLSAYKAPIPDAISDGEVS